MAHILVVEPEIRTQHVMRRILEDAGHEVEVAEDDQSAARLHSSHPADVVIVDVVDELPRAIFTGARVLALPGGLASRGPELSEKLRLVRAQHTLPKPFRGNDLLAAVETVLAMPAPDTPQ